MNNRQKISLIFLTLLLMTLFGALYLSRQNQEIREKAAEACTITFDSSIYSQPNSWRSISPTPPATAHYQVLTSASTSDPNQVRINFSCGFNISKFTVKNGNNYIGSSCYAYTTGGPSGACEQVFPYYCLMGTSSPQAPSTSGYVICKSLPKGRYDISLEFYPK